MLALLLVLGFILNYFVKPLDKKHFMSDAELKVEMDLAYKKDAASSLRASSLGPNKTLQKLILPIAWIVVGVPIVMGISNALQKGIIIFL
jgi:hypothetical protein